MEFQIYTGESIAESLTALGLPSAFIDKTITCTTIKYHFNLEDITKLPKVKKVAELLSATCHEPIRVLSSQIGHFCLEFIRQQRELPTYWQCFSALENKPEASIVFGINDNNQILTYPIDAMPHLLIAGASGSGKSVFLNNIIMNICHFCKRTGLVLIDPKQVEFSQFENVPQLMRPVVTDTQTAIDVLAQLCDIMDDRYAQLRANRMRDNSSALFSKIVVIIDELADLMLTSKHDVEDYIVRIAQKGRACGIHLILATQRPTVNVVTGLIKANIPCRVCFSTTSVRDSVVMLDRGGAEKLLGKGDCLVQLPDRSNLIHVQAPYLSSEDIQQAVPQTPRIWKNYQNTAKKASKTRKTSFINKILERLGFIRNRAKFSNNSRMSTSKSQVPYNIDEQNFFDCVDDEK